MSLISSSIPNFVNGVSQQPFTLRLSSQGEAQENGLSTVSAGLQKRPPTEHIAKVSGPLPGDAYIHTINRDGTEQYQVVITNGDLKVYALDGSARTVNFTNKPYLNTARPVGESFGLTTVADYTFIVNKSKVAAANTSLTTSRPHEALFNVKLGNYGKTYSVLINGSPVATYGTPDGSTATDSPKLATDYIALQLYTALNVAPYNAAPWALSLHGSVIHLSNSSADFTVGAEDGFGGNAMVAIKDALQKFSDLPANPRVDGFMVQIVGDQASDFDNYWVRFEGQSGASNTSGVWKETVAPGISTGLDPLTMPHVLIREADGTFTFKPATWTTRKVGDLASNPNPSFVGRTINDIFFFQNRLGFLSDENYIQSETGKYFNVFRTTVTTLLDSDPVDVNAATNKVAILEHAVGFDKRLILFSNQQQFVVDSEQLMTPKKVPIKPTTDFSVNTLAKPVAAGRNIYFAQDKGRWSAVREFFADGQTNANDATDVSSHVPRYIPSGVTRIAAGPNEDVLVLLSKEDRSKLFVYKYFFSGNEKLQSSWSRFSFGVGGDILNCDFIDSVLYLLVARSDGVYLERMDFSQGNDDLGEPYRVLLDRKVQVPHSSLTFDGTYTTVNPGYVPNDGDYMAVTKGGGAIKPALLLTVDSSGRIRGDYTASDLTVGKKYLWRYVLSTLTLKVPSQGGGLKSDTEGRTQVRRIAFNHADTGYYNVTVTPEARQTYTYPFSGKVLGSPSSEIGTQSLATGRFNAPVMSQNTTVEIALESDMPLPVSILSADWEAFYVKRSRPV